MGFLESDVATGTRSNRRIPLDMLERNGCRLCSLDQAKIRSPKMEPLGPSKPLIYVLGEAPGQDEDKQDAPFVGRSGRLLKSHIPNKFADSIRYSNVVQCWTGLGNPDPTEVQMACCRGRVVSDIEKSRPEAIFGFGNFPLVWATGQSRITLWRGRRFPIKVGSHTCWYYAMLHPSYILHRQNDGFDEEPLFGLDMRRAFAEVGAGLPVPQVHTVQDARRNLTLVRGDEPSALHQVLTFLAKASAAVRVGVDYETNGTRPYATGAKVLSAAVALPDEALAFGWDHSEAGWSASDKQKLHTAWINFLKSKVVKVVHFLGFELEWSGVLFGRDIIRASRWEDTATQAATLDERVGDHKNGPLSLGFLTLQHYGIDIKKLSKVDRKNLESEPLDAVLPYNAIDAKYHLGLDAAQMLLIKQQKRVHIYEDMLRRVPTCVLTQIKGIPTDLNETKRLSAKYGDELDAIYAQIQHHGFVQRYNTERPESFNPSSGPHVRDLFTNFLNINFGNSADEEALKATGHPFSELILRHRKLTKRKSTYVDSWLPGKFLWPDGLLHHQLNSLFAQTGRSSAEVPNIQNQIKRDEEGKEVRRQVRARPGEVMLAADHGQIQFRNIAMESRDPVLCKMLWEDYDVHTDWANELAYAYPYRVGGLDEYKGSEKVRKTFRNDVKNQFVFPLCFGAQDESAASYLKMPIEAVRPVYRKFWRIFEGVLEWHNRLKKLYRENGYTESLAGGRRHAPLTSNMVINSPIQHLESVVVFDGFNRLSETGNPLLQANMEIHDDLVFFLPVDQVYEYAKIIVSEMLACPFEWINVPLSVEVSIGDNWLDMKEVHKFRSDKWNGRPHRNKAYV